MMVGSNIGAFVSSECIESMSLIITISMYVGKKIIYF